MDKWSDEIIYAKICPYCGSKPKLVDSSEIYGRGRDFGKMIWCKPCDAYVGTHRNSPTHKPLGRLANKELREWKKKVHNIFDPLWRRKIQKSNINKSKARFLAYQWLSKTMKIPLMYCHIGMFDLEQCKEAYNICLPYKK